MTYRAGCTLDSQESSEKHISVEYQSAHVGSSCDYLNRGNRVIDLEHITCNSSIVLT